MQQRNSQSSHEFCDGAKQERSSRGDPDGDVFVTDSNPKYPIQSNPVHILSPSLSLSLSPRQLFLSIPNLASFSLLLRSFYFIYLLVTLLLLDIPSSRPSLAAFLDFLHQPFKAPFSVYSTFLLISRFFSFRKKKILADFVIQFFLLSGIFL